MRAAIFWAEASHLLASQPPAPRPEKPTVTVDIEIAGRHAADEEKFGELLGTGFRWVGCSIVSDRDLQSWTC